MKIYLTKPMKGYSFAEVVGYYNDVQDVLETQGWTVLNPMTGKDYLAKEKELRSHGYDQPLSCDRAIFTRDSWMVHQADVLLVNLVGCKEVSIGTMFEMAWGYDNRKHIVTVMEKGGIHHHAFVLEASHVLYHDINEALDYLGKLVKAKI